MRGVSTLSGFYRELLGPFANRVHGEDRKVFRMPTLVACRLLCYDDVLCKGSTV